MDAFLDSICKQVEIARVREVLGTNRRQSQESRLEFGWVSALDREGQTLWIVDAHRDDGKRYVVRADELLTAFLELETVIRGRMSGST